MNEHTRKALKNPETWLRLPVMALFFAMLLIATPLLIGVAVYAWAMLLFTAEVPSSVTRFGKDMGAWFDRASRYLTGAAARRPFPFEDLDCPRDPVPGARSAAAVSPSARTQATASVARADGDAVAETPPAAGSVPAGKKADKKVASKTAKKKGKKTAKKTAAKTSSKTASETASKTAKKKRTQSGGKKAASKKAAASESSREQAAAGKSARKTTAASEQAASAPAEEKIGVEKESAENESSTAQSGSDQPSASKPSTS